ncbi:Monovalent cation:proton antiporter-2 family protein (N-terminal fragment) [Xanthomonas euvesicatoria pv. vesicatoria str. 85-10]|uniref:Monovalent cation:proton antiporter-2 family protein (N-terminal) n=1 Tax=Xanthomonas euvesicatoria pv. vesicatoria (strain 85-10) TaxID=316273 RepID=Q3BQC9_XANE5|nr:Monovalent cation:proton antiporter-2 family protein (N-terminal fragment) [Xanthomonas euvesicatoria pv. vesicatoria str. 85-10]
MHHDTSLIDIIAVGLAVAFILGTLAQKVKLSPLVGYLLAGVCVGPFTPGFVADQTIANQLSELGVMLLMFGVGLHYFARRFDGSEVDRGAWRIGADRGGHPARLGAGVEHGLVADSRLGVRPGAVGGQYGGAVACAGRTPFAGHPARPHRGGLADCRRPGDGAGIGVAPGAGGCAR